VNPAEYPTIKLNPEGKVNTGFQGATGPAATGKVGARLQPTGRRLEYVRTSTAYLTELTMNAAK